MDEDTTLMGRSQYSTVRSVNLSFFEISSLNGSATLQRFMSTAGR